MNGHASPTRSPLLPLLLVATVAAFVLAIAVGATFALRGESDRAPVAERGGDEGSQGGAPEAGGGSSSSSDGGGFTLRAGDVDRSLAITFRSTPTAFNEGIVTLEGRTGRNLGGLAGAGGFIVSVYANEGSAKCETTRSEAYEKVGTSSIELVSMNVFTAGPFRDAGDVYPTAAGRYRVCGYITRGNEVNPGDLLLDEMITVEEADETQPPKDFETRIGTYEAKADAIVGGGSGSSITLTLTGDPTGPKITRVDVKNVTLSTCPSVEDDDRRGKPDSAVLTKEGPTPNELIGSSFTTYFSRGSRSSDATVVGGSTGDELHGVVGLTTEDGQCSGSFAFLAKLKGGG